MYYTKSCHKFYFLFKDVYFVNKIKQIQKNIIYSLGTNQLKKLTTIQNVHFLRLHTFSDDLAISQMLNTSLI